MPSNKTSCIEHPARAALVIIREDYLAICDGDHCRSALINYFEHWTNSKLDDLEEYEDASAHDIELSLPEVWIFASTQKIVYDLFGLYKRAKVSQELEHLVAVGFLARRNNPTWAYDQTYQYKLDVAYVQLALSEIKQSIAQKQAMERSKTGNALPKNRQAIPETPSKTPSKTQKRDSMSPDGDGGSSSGSRKRGGKKKQATPVEEKATDGAGEEPTPPGSGASPSPYSEIWAAVNEVWGHDGFRAGNIAAVIAGVSQVKGWKEFNFTKPGNALGVRVFKDWYALTCKGAALPEDGEGIQTWYGKMRRDYDANPDKAVFDRLRQPAPVEGAKRATSVFRPKEGKS